MDKRTRSALFNLFLNIVIVLASIILVSLVLIWSLNTLFGLHILINHKTLTASIFLMLLTYIMLNGIDFSLPNKNKEEVEDDGIDEAEDDNEDEEGYENEEVDIAKLFIIARNDPQPDDAEAYKKYIMDKFSPIIKMYIGKETQTHFMCVERKLKARNVREIAKSLLIEKRIVSRFHEPFIYKEEKDDAGYKVTLILVGVDDNYGHYI
ncbi:membrane protein [Candidatus Magnetobacterium bavaricum]|uniref:Membrane protein n=1 Tax=Candidatus Magnetobacterium bavaricum TaxID=29290 RepID=A0A0F3GZ88_9BACT|nr:membrane protein [Candidatus Magnetobacterium bavaricum]